MLLLKIAPVILLALTAGAEKKIELQDIEEDNLKSENEKDIDKSEPRTQISNPTAPGLQTLDFFKSGLLRYFEGPHVPQQPRYVQQYAVTEPPEKPVASSKAGQYVPSGPQQAMVGYLSNIPMQFYLVPQYYNEPSEQANTQAGVQYASPAITRVPTYAAPEALQHQANYIEIPAYVTSTGKAYVQQYTTPIGYVQYAAPTIAPTQVSVAPVIAYQPVIQYPTSLAAPPVVQKGYYQNPQYTQNNQVDVQENEVDNTKEYSTQAELPYGKPSNVEYPRYYTSRVPVREDYRHGTQSVSELPPPNPILLKSPPPHLSHIPKALPMYRPLSKPVYAAGGGLIANAYTPRPNDAYGVPIKRRPTSLLDSYVPSNVQIEYLKRGYSKDPISAYEALSSARHFPHYLAGPRQYERGFLPNQMYHTGGGAITYGHYKRTPKHEALPHK